MILLAGFLQVLLRAFVFIGLALSIGGIAFHYAVLRPLATRGFTDDGNAIRVASLVGFGAFLAAFSQFLALGMAPWALADEAGHWPLAVFLSTGYARAGMLNAAFGFCLGITALRLRQSPRSSAIWGTAACFALMLLGSGAWLVHGASRLEHSAVLMTATVLHQAAVTAWAGGTMHLVAQWRLLRGSAGGEEVWPRLLARFSPLAICSVALLVTAGAYLSWHYVHGFDRLIGTAYGTMLVTKVTLMVCALGFGGMNFLAIRRWKGSGDPSLLVRRTPPFIEAEAGIGTAILMAAAAFTAQPPPVDLQEWVTAAEVLEIFAPKVPQLVPAPHAEMLAGAAPSLDPYALPTALMKIQSDFNHNISGIFVILIATAAFLDRSTGARWARHWPLLFLPFALFLLLFAEPNGWPFGNEGFWESLAAPDVLQHRLATFLVIGLGLFEWRVRAGRLATTGWGYAFPFLCGIGGALLLTHSHTVFAVTWAFLIEVSHNAIGILSVLMGVCGWLELRLPGREGRIAGLAWPFLFMLVGVVLLFYREV